VDVLDDAALAAQLHVVADADRLGDGDGQPGDGVAQGAARREPDHQAGEPGRGEQAGGEHPQSRELREADGDRRDPDPDVEQAAHERELGGGLRQERAARLVPPERALEGDVDEAGEHRGEREQHQHGDHVARAQVGGQGRPEMGLRGGGIEGRKHRAARLISRSDPSTAKLAARARRYDEIHRE
jgi:hypothetical protein